MKMIKKLAHVQTNAAQYIVLVHGGTIVSMWETTGDDIVMQNYNEVGGQEEIECWESNQEDIPYSDFSKNAVADENKIISEKFFA